jgi:hypothetical protein
MAAGLGGLTGYREAQPPVGTAVMEGGGKLPLRGLSRVASAVLEDVRLAIYRQNHGTLVGMGFVEGPNPAPYEFTGTAYPIVVVERALKNECLLNFGMFVHRQGRPRLPFEEARHLPLGFVFVKNLDGDAVKLGWLPSHILWSYVN